MVRRTVQLGPVVLLLVMLVGLVRAAQAGGWSVVTLDSTPMNVEAGKPLTLGFMVLQHGTRPMGDLKPRIDAWLAGTKERVTAVAHPEGETGHYVATLTFPTAGEWTWQIDAFGPVAPMTPIKVIAPAAKNASGVGAARPIQTWLIVAGGVVTVMVVGSALLSRRRRQGLPSGRLA